MPGDREPITIVEIDVDYCDLSFGIGVCTASLSGLVVRKCYNTFATCPVGNLFDLGVKTLRFVQPAPTYPKGATVFPYLISADGSSGMVNIAGSDDRMSSLGVRAEVSIRMVDRPYHDRFTDKYAADRVSGAAQTDEGGYDPYHRGTFWTKLKARFPNYSDRPIRIIQGTLDDGVFTAVSTRHFIMISIDGPGNDGSVTIRAKDILALADDDRAVAPKTSNGVLATDITNAEMTFNLLPVGIGAQYPAGGRGVIGSEAIDYTRTGDVVTITARAVGGSTIGAHKANDTFQVCFSARAERIDSVLYRLLVDYANVPIAFCDVAGWAAEVDRWATNMLLTTDITKPEGVSKLIGELAILGVSVWWDDIAQLIKIKMNRPPDTDAVATIGDDGEIIAITQQDRDDDRLTRCAFYSVAVDITNGVDKNNFARQRLTIDAEAENPLSYGKERLREIYCRWLNQGNDSLIKIISRRLINRFNNRPVIYEFAIDIRDDLSLTDVIELQSRVASDVTGKPANELMQVIQRNDDIPGHRVTIMAQSYKFDGRYGFITDNARPVYASSSAAQKARGAYFVDETTLLFGDGTGPYRFI